MSLDHRVSERARVLAAFLEAEQDGLARACHEMAARFARGGTLIAVGTGAAATDAAHVAVEFMHPVIVGKRALPAIAPTNDPSRASTLGRLAGPDDIVLGLAHAREPLVERVVADAARRGILTVGLGVAGADHHFDVPCEDPAVVQEVQETAYHVLWELVHVFFEHPGLLEERCITCGDVAVECQVVEVAGSAATVERGGAREEVAVDLVEVEVGDRVLCHAGVALEKVPDDDPAAFLYPFLDSAEDDLAAVLADLRASTLRKGADVTALRSRIDPVAIERAAADLRARLDRGGRLIAFGNGGSATDAQDAAADALGRGWPAIALVNDAPTVTAVANDVGFENVFARQLIPLGREADVALAISTSGSSPSIVSGLEEAHRRGMLTIAIAGYDGGRVARLPWIDHLFVVEGDYVPRLQEAQATIYHLLLEAA